MGSWFVGEEGCIRKDALLEQGEPFVSWIKCNECPQVRFNERDSGTVAFPGSPRSAFAWTLKNDTLFITTPGRFLSNKAPAAFVYKTYEKDSLTHLILREINPKETFLTIYHLWK